MNLTCNRMKKIRQNLRLDMRQFLLIRFVRLNLPLLLKFDANQRHL